MIRAAALGALIALASGCSTVVYERTSLRAGELPGHAVPRTGASKAEVLATLGAPLEVLPRPGGDLFVYRVRRTDVVAVNVNTGMLVALALPLYSHTSGERRDALVHVYFDRAGRVEHVARREVQP